MQLFINNHYDKLAIEPVLDVEQMPIGLERLARKLIVKGLLRISAYERCNFVIHPVDRGYNHLTFTKRELYNKILLKKTSNTLVNFLDATERQNPKEAIRQRILLMRKRLKKFLEVPPQDEIKIARMLVQTVPAIIINNLILDEINIFVSYGHTIADLLDVRMWQRARYSQGLQSNNFEEANIFVSCGGNPFFDPKESANDYDGFSAKARLMIVAAQEIAHYADIIKDYKGRNIDRFSSAINMSYPKRICEEFRQADLQNTDRISALVQKAGASKLFDIERSFKIKLKYNKYSIFNIFRFIRMRFLQAIFKMKCRELGLKFVDTLNDKEGIAKEALLCCGDMKFNLEPKSEAYKNPNKNIEKAIACAEALARVPQQEVKWGKKAVKEFTPNLQKYFYEFLVQDEMNYYKIREGKDFIINLEKPKLSLSKSLSNLNKNIKN